jgi:hypothetical protein
MKKPLCLKCLGFLYDEVAKGVTNNNLLIILVENIQRLMWQLSS